MGDVEVNPRGTKRNLVDVTNGTEPDVDATNGNEPDAKKRKVATPDDAPTTVYILFEETNLDDYKNRGEDWQDTSVVGVFRNEADAVDKLVELKRNYVMEEMTEKFDGVDPSSISPRDQKDTDRELYVNNFVFARPAPTEPKEPKEPRVGEEQEESSEEDEDLTLQLKPEADVSAIFAELTKGEFCVRTLQYYINSYKVE
jgi:hypothetical protein